MNLAVDFYASSDLGLVRTNNEDSAFAGPRLLALADGMGGHAAGEVASQLMIAALAPLDEDEPGSDLTGALVKAMHVGNDAIAQAVKEDPAREGMGCTLTAMLFDGRRAGLLHVGDSRAYLLRDGELSQLTRDDTFVQSMVDEGKLSADEAHSHPQRSLIMKALTGHEVEPSTAVREVRVGDRYMLCSDGLSDPVSESTILETLSNGTPAESAERLVALALRSGGPDNISVVIGDIVDGKTAVATRPMVVGAASSETTATIAPANSAAARAAAFTRAQAASKAEKDDAAAGDPTATTDDKHTVPEASTAGKAKARGDRRRTILPLVVVLALIAAGVLAVGLLIRSNYFVAEDSDRVAIRQGLSGEVFGVALSSTTQLACLSDSGQLTTFDADAIPPDCNVFTLSDLREGARHQVLAGLPSGSLTEAQAQMSRLATDELLPPCSDFAPAEGEAPADSSASPRSSQAPAPRSSEARPTPSDQPSNTPEPSNQPVPTETAQPQPPRPVAAPGMNCRAVR